MRGICRVTQIWEKELQLLIRLKWAGSLLVRMLRCILYRTYSIVREHILYSMNTFYSKRTYFIVRNKFNRREHILSEVRMLECIQTL